MSPLTAGRYALAAAGPSGALGCATKAHKALRLHAGAGELAVALLPDLAIAVALVALCFGAAALGRGRRPALTLAHALVAAAGLASVVEHAFYLATGSLLDPGMIAYTIANAVMLRDILLSEVSLGSAAALAGVGLLTLLPLLTSAGRARWHRQPPSSPSSAPPSPPPPAPRAALVSAAALALVAALAVAPLTARARAALAGELQLLAPAPLATLAGGALDLAARAASAPPPADRPARPLVVARGADARDWNVVIVALESVRASATTPYNPTLATTPFLASVARRGLRAERAYTAVPHTTKSLLPIHCGYYPKVAPGFDEAFPGALPTECLAATLARLGWATAYVQSSESVFEKNEQLVANFGYRTSIALDDLRARGDDARFDAIGYFGLEDDAMLAPLLEWVDARGTQPFALGLVTLASHHPYDVPAGFVRRRFADDPRLDDYLNAVAYTDRTLAKLHAAFAERGLLERTVFVYIGDHGEGFGEHGLFQHDELLYEEGVRVPLLIEAPGLRPQVVAGLRQNIDVVPTVLELLGLRPLAGELAGRSLLSTPGHRRLPMACWHRDRCMAEIEDDGRGGLRKVIHAFDRRPIAAYDLVADPDERDDLVACGALSAATLQPAVERLLAWRRDANARFDGQDARRAAAAVQRAPPVLLHPSAPLDVRFGDGATAFARLLDASVAEVGVEAGGATELRLVWQVLATPPPGWTAFWHLQRGDAVLARSDWVPAEGSYPVDAWRTGETIEDRVFVRPGPGLRAGQLDVLVGFWRRESGARASVTGRGLAKSSDDRVLVATLALRRPDGPPPSLPLRPFDSASVEGLGVAPLAGPRPLDIAFAPAAAPAAAAPAAATPATAVAAAAAAAAAATSPPFARLRRAWVDRAACPGAELSLHLAFEVEAAPPRFSRLFVHLRGANGRHRNLGGMAETDGPPVDGWRAGDVVVYTRHLRLHDDWPLGETSVRVGFFGPNVALPGGRMAVAPAAARAGPGAGQGAADALRLPVVACP